MTTGTGAQYAHQDWTPVIFKKKQDNNKQHPSQVSSSSVAPLSGNNKARNASLHNATAKPAWKIEKQVDDDNAKAPLPMVSVTDAQAIVSGRVAMKLTQKELAQRLNMQEREIKDIESHKAVENKQVLNKIKRFLKLSGVAPPHVA